MDPKDALHTGARRHCNARYEQWTKTYNQLLASGREHTDEAHSTFPRYLVWEAILDEVERLETRLIPTMDVLREELVAAGARAETPMTTNPALSPPGKIAMAEEREAFAHFIRSVQEVDLDTVEPLPLRRVFRDEEVQRLSQMLDLRWGMKGDYWWPLRQGPQPPNVLSFHRDWFDAEKESALREILADHKVERVWELRELGQWGCEESADAFEPVACGRDAYWTSSGIDWLVYASHESSIALAGEWLVEDFRRRFPDCEKFPYVGPMSTPDQRGKW